MILYSPQRLLLLAFLTFKEWISLPLKYLPPYKICLLEQCLLKDYETEQNRQWLELCWQKTMEISTEIPTATTIVCCGIEEK